MNNVLVNCEELFMYCTNNAPNATYWLMFVLPLVFGTMAFALIAGNGNGSTAISVFNGIVFGLGVAIASFLLVVMAFVIAQLLVTGYASPIVFVVAIFLCVSIALVGVVILGSGQ
jgi:hypothetical protein